MSAAARDAEIDAVTAALVDMLAPPRVARVRIRAVCKCGCGALNRFFIDSAGRVFLCGLPTMTLALCEPAGRA